MKKKKRLGESILYKASFIKNFYNNITRWSKNEIKREFYLIALLAGLTIPFLLTANLYAPDGVAYFGCTHSIVIDKDLLLKNEIDYYHVPSHIQEKWFYLTQKGLVSFPFAIGASLASIPFFFLGHLLTKIASSVGTVIPLGLGGDSYQGSYLYVAVVSLGNCFYAICGFFLTLRLLQKFFSKENSLLACITIWFASPFTFVFYKQATYSHLFESFTVIMFIYAWFVSERNHYWFWWFCVGLIFALMVLARWQNLVIGILLLIPPPRINFRLFISWIFFLLGGFIGLLPQLITWKIIYGKFLLVPQGGEYMNWWHPEILNLLFSSWHGLYSWTPITVFSTLGLLLIWKKSKRLCIGLTLIFFLQIYINSCVSDWWGGTGFSARRMAGYTSIFMIGLTSFYSSRFFSGWRNVFKYLFLGLSILYTTNLISAMFSTSDSLAEYRSYPEFFRIQLDTFMNFEKYPFLLSSNSLVAHFKVFGIPKIISLTIIILFFLCLRISYEFIERITTDDAIFPKKTNSKTLKKHLKSLIQKNP